MWEDGVHPKQEWKATTPHSTHLLFIWLVGTSPPQTHGEDPTRFIFTRLGSLSRMVVMLALTYGVTTRASVFSVLVKTVSWRLRLLTSLPPTSPTNPHSPQLNSPSPPPALHRAHTPSLVPVTQSQHAVMIIRVISALKTSQRLRVPLIQTATSPISQSLDAVPALAFDPNVPRGYVWPKASSMAHTTPLTCAGQEEKSPT